MLAPAALQAETAPAPPARVVSINLCTDQLAMMLAAPGQLHSVSWLATDPRSSAMAEEAAAYTANRALAEEIYLMRPDLVLAGNFGNRATLDMLRRLGIPVATFPAAQSISDIPGLIARMGEALGQEDQATDMAAAFERRLAALRTEVAERPSAALYFASGYTAGDTSLAGEILLAAGFENIAEEAGYPHGGFMPLEVLAMSAPDAVISSRPYPRASRAEAMLDHPVVRALRASRARGSFTDHDWMCGTPHVLEAVTRLGGLRQAMEAQRE
jgi:iron complex transport system substrate-binding protein